MYAVETKYLGPTDNRGSRVKATLHSRIVTMPWNCGIDVRSNHRLAAYAVLAAAGYDIDNTALATGETKAGYVHVVTNTGGL